MKKLKLIRMRALFGLVFSVGAIAPNSPKFIEVGIEPAIS